MGVVCRAVKQYRVTQSTDKLPQHTPLVASSCPLVFDSYFILFSILKYLVFCASRPITPVGFLGGLVFVVAPSCLSLAAPQGSRFIRFEGFSRVVVDRRCVPVGS